MMRIAIHAAAGCILMLAAGRPAQGWTVQHPLPTAQVLTAVAFRDSDTGFAAGYGRTWLKTTDGGREWIPQSSWTGRIVMRMEFLGRDTGFAYAWDEAGADKALSRTVDGGKSWRTARFPDSAQCDPGAYHFIDGSNGWAACPHVDVPNLGYVFRTANGGLSWETQLAFQAGGLHAVFFLDARRGWAVGDSSVILHTRDGGRTWDRQTWIPQGIPALRKLTSVFFLDSLAGWFAGDYGALARTVDGGAAWEDASMTGNRFAWIRFANRDTGWVEGVSISGNEFLRSVDGGRTWVPKALPALHNRPMDLHLQDSRRAWVVGSAGSILRTLDAGDTWEIRSPGTRLRIDWIHMIDGSTGWAAGSNGTLLKTVDAGRNWIQQRGGPSTIIHRIQFADARTGWLATGYSVLATTDGGATWGGGPQPGGAEYPRFLDAQRGYSVGRSGVVRRTVDGGRSWQHLDTVTAASLYDVHFADPLRGIAVGSGGTAIRTRDGGETWDVAVIDNRRELVAVQMLDSNRAWTGARNLDGTLYKTEDGGATWTPGPDLGEPVRSIHFSGPLHGAAAGGEGIILRTRDGGRTWLRQSIPTASALDVNSVFVLDSARAWAAGESGLIVQDGPLAPSSFRPMPGRGAGGAVRLLAGDLLEYRLVRDDWVRVRILDLRGRSLDLFAGMQGAGTHRLGVPGRGNRPRGALLDVRAGTAREVLRLP